MFDREQRKRPSLLFIRQIFVNPKYSTQAGRIPTSPTKIRLVKKGLSVSKHSSLLNQLVNYDPKSFIVIIWGRQKLEILSCLKTVIRSAFNRIWLRIQNFFTTVINTV